MKTGGRKPISEAVESMIVALGLSEAAVTTRKAFLGFSEADVHHLKKLHEAFEDRGPTFAKRFCEHMLSFPETRRFITDSSILDRLQQAQAEYFGTLTAGHYGSDYIRNRLRAGIAHQRIGLETQWYLGAYAKYLVDLMPEIWQKLGADHEAFIAALQSLLKVVLLDMGLAVDTYIHTDRRMILALQEYAERVFSAIPDGLCVLASDFTVLSANRAFLDRFDLSKANLRGRSLLAVIAADGLGAKLSEVCDSGMAQHDLLFEMGRVGESTRHPVRVTLSGMRLEEEARLLVVVEDITEQVRLQQALKESEATLLHAQEITHIGSWKLDFKTGVLTWTPEVGRLFDLPFDPPQDTPISYDTFLANVHPDDREMLRTAWQAAIKGVPYRIQHRIVARGETRWMEERVALVFDDDCQPVRAVGTVQDITEHKAAEIRIENLAFYDMLTGLPNRALFMDRFKHELAAAERRAQRLSLLFLDLNRFKEINDTLGHDTGDRVLSEVAHRLRLALREEETLARLSGDEFVIIASDSSEAASHIAERIGRAFSAPFLINGQSFAISASIGIAIFPEDGRSTEELLKHADIAMYRAKGGGGGYCFYSAEMGEALVRKRAVAKRLEAALSNGGLQLFYQSQIHLSNGRLAGAEALARWQDAQLGVISPTDFIPIAEERGLIGTLGEWVLHEACHQVRLWQERHYPMPGKVAVNIATRQFEDDDFVDRMLRIAREHRIAANRIELELTENGMMRDPERAVDIARALASAGFALSIDDFGTGYSSLSYLQRFPVNKLKIDISFIRHMLTDRNDYATVSTIIAMGKSMELETLAEGVEQAEQVDALLSLGCMLAQGYHFGHPLAANDFERTWLSHASS